MTYPPALIATGPLKGVTSAISSACSRAWESTRDWFGVGTPSSHGSMPTQWTETHSVARGLGLVSVSQGHASKIVIGHGLTPQALFCQRNRGLAMCFGREGVHS